MPKFTDFDLDLQSQKDSLATRISPRTKMTCYGEYSICLLCPYTFQADCRTEYNCSN